MDYPKEYSATLIKMLEQVKNDKLGINKDLKELGENERIIYIEAMQEIYKRLREKLDILTDKGINKGD